MSVMSLSPPPPPPRAVRAALRHESCWSRSSRGWRSLPRLLLQGWGGSCRFFGVIAEVNVQFVSACIYLYISLRTPLNRCPFVSRGEVPVDMPSHMETVKQWGMMRWINCSFLARERINIKLFPPMCLRFYYNITNIKYFILYKEIRLYHLMTLIQQPENHSGLN